MSGTRKKFNIHSRGTQDRLFCFILLLPAIILCITFIIIPIIDSVWMSFTDYKIANLTQGIPGKWNNFANYTRLWDSGKLQSAAGITIFFVFVTVLLTFIVSMTLALILNTKIVGARFLRSIMMIPWVIPTVIAGLLWAWIYANPYGLLQYLVSIFSGGKITGFGILNNQSTALWGIIIAALWKQIPLMALLLLSGMQSIPDDMLEAAKIDGANYINCLFRIIIPHMKSVIAVTVSMCIIENFKQYPLFATLTNGGPAGATTTFAVLSYDEAFVNFNYGSGAAVTTIWLLMMIVVVFIFNKIFKQEEAWEAIYEKNNSNQENHSESCWWISKIYCSHFHFCIFIIPCLLDACDSAEDQYRILSVSSNFMAGNNIVGWI